MANVSPCRADGTAAAPSRSPSPSAGVGGARAGRRRAPSKPAPSAARGSAHPALPARPVTAALPRLPQLSPPRAQLSAGTAGPARRPGHNPRIPPPQDAAASPPRPPRAPRGAGAVRGPGRARGKQPGLPRGRTDTGAPFARPHSTALPAGRLRPGASNGAASSASDLPPAPPSCPAVPGRPGRFLRSPRRIPSRGSPGPVQARPGRRPQRGGGYRPLPRGPVGGGTPLPGQGCPGPPARRPDGRWSVRPRRGAGMDRAPLPRERLFRPVLLEGRNEKQNVWRGRREGFARKAVSLFT